MARGKSPNRCEADGCRKRKRIGRYCFDHVKDPSKLNTSQERSMTVEERRLSAQAKMAIAEAAAAREARRRLSFQIEGAAAVLESLGLSEDDTEALISATFAEKLDREGGRGGKLP